MVTGAMPVTKGPSVPVTYLGFSRSDTNMLGFCSSVFCLVLFGKLSFGVCTSEVFSLGVVL